MSQRLQAICEILMGAAYADSHFDSKEKEAVLGHLQSLSADSSEDCLKWVEAFDRAAFSLPDSAKILASESQKEREHIISLVASIHAADDEYDFAEDAYLHEVAEALSLNEDALKEHALDYEVEELSQTISELRKSPPPIPKS